MLVTLYESQVIIEYVRIMFFYLQHFTDDPCTLVSQPAARGAQCCLYRSEGFLTKISMEFVSALKRCLEKFVAAVLITFGMVYRSQEFKYVALSNLILKSETTDSFFS